MNIFLSDDYGGKPLGSETASGSLPIILPVLLRNISLFFLGAGKARYLRK